MTKSTRKPDDWMPFHIGPYLKDTMDLTTEQHGAYILLLLAYWMRQGPLPDDDAKLASIAKIDLKKWKKSMRAAVSVFFEIRDGFWRQNKAEEEIIRAIGLTETRAIAGKRGGEASAKARTKPEANVQANQPAKPEQTGQQTPKQTATPSNLNSTNLLAASSVTRARESELDDKTAYARLCELLPFDPNDHRNWTAFIEMRTIHGLDFERHIVPAAEHHRKSGKPGNTLSYIRPKALELKQQLEIADTAPVVFEDCDDTTWRGRIRFWLQHPEMPEEKRWPAKWGKRFDSVPENIRCEFAKQIGEPA